MGGLKDKFTWFIVAVIYMAILYSLVRPGSKGTQTVNQLFTLFTDMIRGATGETYANGSWSSTEVTSTSGNPVNGVPAGNGGTEVPG